MNYLPLEPIGSGKEYVTTEHRPLIKNEECDAVLLSVWNVEDDDLDTPKPTGGGNLYEETQNEIFWGTKGSCVHQLFPAQNSGLIPVSNANQIFIRSNFNKGGEVMVAYTLFKIRS